MPLFFTVCEFVLGCFLLIFELYNFGSSLGFSISCSLPLAAVNYSRTVFNERYESLKLDDIYKRISKDNINENVWNNYDFKNNQFYTSFRGLFRVEDQMDAKPNFDHLMALVMAGLLFATVAVHGAAAVVSGDANKVAGQMWLRAMHMLALYGFGQFWSVPANQKSILKKLYRSLYTSHRSFSRCWIDIFQFVNQCCGIDSYRDYFETVQYKINVENRSQYGRYVTPTCWRRRTWPVRGTTQDFNGGCYSVLVSKKYNIFRISEWLNKYVQFMGFVLLAYFAYFALMRSRQDRIKLYNKNITILSRLNEPACLCVKRQLRPYMTRTP